MKRLPNIVYILADDMGYGDVSCLNSESKIHTAHIDRLAAEGMAFTDAHACSAVCTPSRYSILTGRYNWRSWLKSHVTHGYSRPLIEEGRMTAASLLRDHGYATGCVGKWHLGWDWGMVEKSEAAEPKAEEISSAEERDRFEMRGDAKPEDVDFAKPIVNGPNEVGFDYFFGISASLDMAPHVYVENDRVTAQPDRVTGNDDLMQYWREGPTGADFEHEQVLPKMTEKAIGFIEEQTQADKPFFLYFPLPAPHTPILPLPEFRGKSGTNLYGDFCLQVDDVVGQVLAALERKGIADNTIVIFTSDNGCSPRADFEELKKLGHNPSYVFRGHKADIYDGGHRIPLLIRWPERIAAGRMCDETVCLVDLLATCADIIGVELPDDAGEDSVSNLDLWQGAAGRGLPDSWAAPEGWCKGLHHPYRRGDAQRLRREATVHHSIDGSFAIRKGRWKLEMCAGSGGWSFPRPGKESEGLPEIQLYDMQADIGERTNVYAQHPEVVEELEALLTQYVENGRSTPGTPQPNTDGPWWPQLWWMKSL